MGTSSMKGYQSPEHRTIVSQSPVEPHATGTPSHLHVKTAEFRASKFFAELNLSKAADAKVLTAICSDSECDQRDLNPDSQQELRQSLEDALDCAAITPSIVNPRDVKNTTPSYQLH